MWRSSPGWLASGMMLALSLSTMTAQGSSHGRWSSGTLPGQTPGTYRGLHPLERRGYNPEAILALARREADPGVRRQILEGLQPLAEQDQLLLKQAIEALGGRLRESYWSANVAHVEVAPARLAEVKALLRVGRTWPIEAREPNATRRPAAAAPDADSGYAYNHNFAGAHLLSSADP